MRIKTKYGSISFRDWLINRYYSIRFRIILKLTYWDRWNDEITYFPAFHFNSKDSDGDRIDYEWNLRRPFKITAKVSSYQGKDIWYFYWFEKSFWQKEFKENKDKFERFNEAEFIDKAWKEETNFMAGVDIL